MKIVYANLDAEARWAGVTLPEHVMRRLRAIAPLTGVLVDGEVEVVGPGDPPPHWDLAWADPDAKAVNDRSWGLALAQAGGFALPGACVIASIDELPRAGAWIAKAPWSSAGRDRAISDPVRAAQLLARCGELVLEPWCERIADVAICALPGGELLPAHGLITNRHGGFVGIDLDAVPLEPAERERLVAAARVAAEGLAQRGYHGPFGVDAFVHEDHGRKFHPMCEVNARYTFGHVAHALARRHGTRRLGFGAPPPGARVVVADPEVTAWVA